MSHSTHKRVSRTFRPSMGGESQLETRLVLDAASIPAEVAAAMEAKQQLKDDLATYQYDFINYRLDVIEYKVDKASLKQEISDFRADVKSFNDQYTPKKATAKFSSAIGAGGIGIPTLTFEVDLTGVKDNVLEVAKSKRDALELEAFRIQGEIGAMNNRAKGLENRGKALQDRKAALDKNLIDVGQKEELAMVDEMEVGVALTDFSDPDLDNRETEVDSLQLELDAMIMEFEHDQQTPDTFTDSYENMGGY